MEILGIGPVEFLFIVIIALILMGPKEMEKAGRTLGRWLNRVVKSDTWQTMRETSKEIRGLPTRLMRDANLDEIQKEMNYRPIMPKPEDAANKPEPAIPDSKRAAPVPAQDVIIPSKSQPFISETPPAPKKSAAPKKKSTGTKTKPAARKPAAKKNKSTARKSGNA